MEVDSESRYPQMIEIHLPCFFSQLTAQPKISWSNLPSSTESAHSVIWVKSGISSSETCCPKNCSMETGNWIDLFPHQDEQGTVINQFIPATLSYSNTSESF